LCLATAGEYGRALRLIHQGLAAAEEIGHRHFMATSRLVLGALFWDILALSVARTHLEQALSLARETNSMVWTRIAASYLASTYTLEGQVAAATSILDDLLAPDLPMHSVGQRQLWYAKAELMLAQGEARAALEVVERLMASAPNVERSGEHVMVPLALLRAEALARLGRTKEAERILQAAQQAAQAYDLLPMRWRLHLGLGRVYLAQGQRDDAADEFSTARGLVEKLAATLDDVALRGGFVKSAGALMGRVSLDSVRRRAKKESGGLTAREREVATLIAQGKSNREIAETLVLSPRTVEVHIANIMSKLGIASRAQIAAWATEKGLRPTRKI
jgi:ATP/maltotriose-dependent transcriptional regulator MalT